MCCGTDVGLGVVVPVLAASVLAVATVVAACGVTSRGTSFALPAIRFSFHRLTAVHAIFLKSIGFVFSVFSRLQIYDMKKPLSSPSP